MILSHVWDESKELEMTFQNIQRIHERCASSGEDPRDLVNTKIRKCCELGERHGYKWAWIDTCCIDKSSSAELMETINAMYQYYALCLVCYVYLPDFWDHDNPEKIRYSMRHTLKPHTQLLVKTRWQQRGWTLQELIAPRIVHFLSSYWEYLGTKNDLADGLERGLGIPASVLRHEQSPLEFSVAQRMSWAANRKTTRPEDEAYSLLGLFGIKMPTLYGEGSKAFQRLQEEIIKQTGDSTLFAWGVSASLDNLRDYPNHAQTGLLASGPFDFSSSRGIQIQKSSNVSQSTHILIRPPLTLWTLASPSAYRVSHNASWTDSCPDPTATHQWTDVRRLVLVARRRSPRPSSQEVRSHVRSTHSLIRHWSLRY